MKNFSTLTMAVTLAGGMAFTGMASADYSAAMSRISSTANGGNVPGNNVENNCGDAFAGASANISSYLNNDGTTHTEIELFGAAPNTHYTVWIRQAGSSHGTSFGGAPITGGGATPYAPTSELQTLIDDWQDAIGSSVARANGFYTDDDGEGELIVDVDFTAEAGGAYPYNRMGAATLADARTKRPAAEATPTAIVDPRDPDISGPFLIRMVSHCSDQKSHGVSPGAREPWFQYP